jgi:hypothetical protein
MPEADQGQSGLGQAAEEGTEGKPALEQAKGQNATASAAQPPAAMADGAADGHAVPPDGTSCWPSRPEKAGKPAAARPTAQVRLRARAPRAGC